MPNQNAHHPLTNCVVNNDKYKIDQTVKNTLTYRFLAAKSAIEINNGNRTKVYRGTLKTKDVLIKSNQFPTIQNR